MIQDKLVKIKKKQNDEQYLLFAQTNQITQQPNGLLLKKQIAKQKGSKKQNDYKRCKLIITPIFENRFIFNHKFMIFGFVEIETQYKNFKDPSEQELINMINSLIKVTSIEKLKKQQCIVLNVQCNGYSGLRDFNFLIDHLSQIPNADYKDLQIQLNDYQKFCIQYVNHFADLKQMINENDYEKSIQDYEIYVSKYIEDNYSESDFYFSAITCLNYQTSDFEPRKYTLSFALLSLLGLEPEQAIQDCLHYSIHFTQLLGMERLNEAVQYLKMFVNNQHRMSYKQTILTADCIQFFAELQWEIIQWPDKPQSLHKYDLIGFVVKVNVSLNQIKSIIEVRSNQSNENLNNHYIPKMQNLFEYSIQSEIFLEKFYPLLFTNPNSHKSLSLRKLNKEINIE